MCDVAPEGQSLEVCALFADQSNIIDHTAEFSVMRHKAAKCFGLIGYELDGEPAFLITGFDLCLQHLQASSSIGLSVY